MSNFRKLEERRQVEQKPLLFSSSACQLGTHNGGAKLYDFCLNDYFADENLHESIRELAISYYENRGISWHSLSHLLSSQIFCANTWFPFFYEPDTLAKVLHDMGYPVREVLPFRLDTLAKSPTNGTRLRCDDGEKPHFVAFEWIGERNYLRELKLGKVGKVAKDDDRTRGQGFTSADFAFRFLRTDGKIQIVLGEWKYIESYSAKDMCVSKSGTDRLKDIYAYSLNKPTCQIQLPSSLPQKDIFCNPFDQMMRLQLLASAMEEHHEMDADIVSALHVCPRANTELLDCTRYKNLCHFGPTIHQVWNSLVKPDWFLSFYTEDLIPILTKHHNDPHWISYMHYRYAM